MEILWYLILTAWTVNSGSISGKPYDQAENQFQNFLHRIRKDDRSDSGTFHEILKHELVREQAFDAMKEELWTAQNRNGYRRKNVYEKSNIGKNAAPKKRETVAENYNSVHSDATSDSDEEDAPSTPVVDLHDELRFDLKMGVSEPFIKEMKQHFAQTLEGRRRASANTTDSKVGASEDELQKELFEIFVNMLNMTRFPVEYIEEPDLLVTTDKILHIFEIKFGIDSDEKADFQCNKKHLPSFLHRGKDVVCWGVHLLTASDRRLGAIGEWKVEVFTEQGELKRCFAETRYVPGTNFYEK